LYLLANGNVQGEKSLHVEVVNINLFDYFYPAAHLLWQLYTAATV
jgi:hypothetical protein